MANGIEVCGGWRSRESKEAGFDIHERLEAACIGCCQHMVLQCLEQFLKLCPVFFAFLVVRRALVSQRGRRCWSFHGSRAGLATCKKVVGACGHEDNCEDVPVSAGAIWIEDSSRYSIKVPTCRGCMVVYRRMVGTGASFPPTCGFCDIYIGQADQQHGRLGFLRQTREKLTTLRPSFGA